MKIEDSKYRLIIKKKITTNEGNFYIFDNFIVGEIKQGAIFNWECAKKVIDQVYNHYDSRDIKVSYVSNRIYPYSLYPQDWLKFFKNRHTLNCMAVVTYERTGLSNYILEKLFIRTKLQKFTSLDAAIVWAKKQSPATTEKSKN